ncbi:L,D-transpeptidase [Arachnia propionica]|uniref:L,D-transpeptidase catalytic domain n=1 Tax=Arachnia propionica TaxID=1750 RepID=A0A3S4UEY8_9ACTN|nr:Ig-like domain-containing protein [Arachnia propionica]QUC15552.1 L,D-transpeptidase family protein [Arachnia propionica]VEH70245.1 L,D-transpeptidase catalytic domain [Arachnia propionica]
MNLRLRSLLVALVGSTLLFSACSPGNTTPSNTPEKTTPTASSTQETSPSPVAPAGALTITSSTDAALPSDPVTLSLENGTITNATVTGPGGAVEGTFEKDAWTPSKALELNTEYKLAATASDGTTKEASFKTVSPGSAETTFNLPYMDDNLGVGMPAYVKFSRAIPQEYRASIEKHAKVTVTPTQEGSWGWISDTELAYRPKEYWKPGTKISLDLKWLGVQATDKTWLKKDSSGAFSIKNVSRVIKVDIANYTTTVVENGEVVKTLPSTTGKEGFVTRSGTKLILEKYDSLKMNSDTIAIPSGSSEAYNLDAQYAMRVTWTGEFIHAAPWSVGSQGKANVSHGCVGLSTDNAGWLYKGTSIGDVVEFTGSDRKMKPSEGMGVWLYSWEEWKALSASGS